MNLARSQCGLFALAFAVALQAAYLALGSALGIWWDRWGIGPEDGPSGHWGTPLFHAGQLVALVIAAPVLFVQAAISALGITTALAVPDVLGWAVNILAWAAVAYWSLGHRRNVEEFPVP